MKIPLTSVLCLSAAFAASLLLACGGGGEHGAASAPRTELTLMTLQLQPRYDPYMNALTASFEAAHPGTHVKWIDFPSEGFLNKLQALFLEGNPPDVVNITYDQGIHVVQQGVLADLRGLVSQDVLDSYFPGVMETACTWKGQVYALPWYLTVYVTMYNRQILQEAGLDPDRPPRTEAELFEMSRVIHARLPGKAGFSETLTEEGRLRDFLAREGVALVREDPDGRLHAAFDTPEGAHVLSMWVEAYESGWIPRDSLNPSHRDAIELYKAGQIAFFVSGAQFLGLIRKDAPDVYAVTDVSPAPTPPIGVQRVDVMQVIVPRRGDTPEARARERLAAELAAFVTNGPNQLAFCRLVPILPSVVATARDPFFTQEDGTLEGKARVISARGLASAEVYLQPYPGMGELNAAMSTAIEKACLGQATPQEALAEAAARWNAVFDAAHETQNADR